VFTSNTNNSSGKNAMLKNLSIKARLILLVSTLSVLMTVIGGGGIAALREENASLETVYEDRLVPVGHLDRVIRLVNRNQLTITTALIHGEGGFGEAAREVHSAREETGKYWSAYMASFAVGEEKALSAEVEAAVRAFDAAFTEPAEAALKAGDAAAVQRLVTGSMKASYMPVRKAMNELIQLQLDVAKREYDSSIQRYHTFMAIAVGMLCGGVAFGAALGVWLVRSVTAPLNQAVEIAEAVAGGDLTRSISIHSNDETGRLLTALRDMQERLADIVSNVRAGTETINIASSEIAVGNADLSQRTEDQAASLEETASSMEELTSTVRQTADNSRQAEALAGSASEQALRGGAVVSEMVVTMNDIRDSSSRIVDIISVIDGIAFQTNILALNAAVEAARAGEQGRGVAVVASEVRSLAHRSASAAREIKELIGTAVEKVQRGTGLMDETGATMQGIVAAVKQVADIIGEISAAGREQSAGIDQINQAIVQIDEATQQNAALVEESAAAAQSMRDEAARLVLAVGVFLIGSGKTGSPTRQASRGGVLAPRLALA
jgi:methyl-accepting chemotaxis protein